MADGDDYDDWEIRAVTVINFQDIEARAIERGNPLLGFEHLAVRDTIPEGWPGALGQATLVAIGKPIPDSIILAHIAGTMDPNDVMMMEELDQPPEYQGGPACLSFQRFPGGICVAWKGERGSRAFGRIAEVIRPMGPAVGGTWSELRPGCLILQDKWTYPGALDMAQSLEAEFNGHQLWWLIRYMRAPPSVGTLGRDCCSDCLDLEAADLAQCSCLLVIESYAFLGCGSLRVVRFPPSLMRIGESAFESTGLEVVDATLNTLDLGDRCFSACPRLAVVRLGAVVLKDMVFSGCVRLTEISVNVLQGVGRESLAGSSVVSLVPEAVGGGEQSADEINWVLSCSLALALRFTGECERRILCHGDTIPGLVAPTELIVGPGVDGRETWMDWLQVRVLDLRQAESILHWDVRFCKNAVEVKIPPSTREIPYGFFQEMWSLERLNLWECHGLSRIQSQALQGCSRLTGLGSLPAIASLCVNKCGLLELDLRGSPLCRRALIGGCHMMQRLVLPPRCAAFDLMRCHSLRSATVGRLERGSIIIDLTGLEELRFTSARGPIRLHDAVSSGGAAWAEIAAIGTRETRPALPV